MQLLKSYFNTCVYAISALLRIVSFHVISFSFICMPGKTWHVSLWSLFVLQISSGNIKKKKKKTSQFVEHWDSKPYDVCKVNWNGFYVKLEIVLYVSTATIKFPNKYFCFVFILLLISICLLGLILGDGWYAPKNWNPLII